MELTADNVFSLFRKCLFDDEEIGPDHKPLVDALYAEGLTMNVGFSKERVEKHKEEIASLCDQLPKQFKEGWTFLNMPMKGDDGGLWGEHRDCEHLLLLGIAAGKMKLLSPKKMWPLLPGGMPYYQVL